MGFNLSYGHVKSALRAFVRIHDITLAEKGQYGVTHSCRSQPYIKTSNLVFKPPNNKTNVSIMNRATLKAYKFDPTIKMKKEKDLATRDQANRLCFGQQLKVC